MSKIRALIGMAAVMAAIAHGGTSEVIPDYFEPKETDEERKKRLAKAEIERNKRNGLKEFKYGYTVIWALNQKSADKRARKLNLYK